MTTDNSKPDKDEFAADDSAADAPTQTTQEAEDEQDKEIWDALDKQEESGEPLAADDSAADDVIDDDPAADDDPGPDTDDVWADATDAQRGAFKASQERAERMEHAHKSEVGRTKTLRRQLSDVTVQLDRAAKNTPPKKDDVEDDGDPADDKAEPSAWDALATEYPEVAGPVNERLSKIEDAQAKKDREDELEAADAKEAHTQTVIEQTDLLAEKHKDWLEVATTPEFATWLDDQPRSIRDVAAVNAKEIVDATGAGDVITRYKASRSDQGDDSDGPDESQDTTDTSLAARRKRQLESGRSSRPKGPGTIVSGIPEDGSDEEIWAGFDKMDARESAKA